MIEREAAIKIYNETLGAKGAKGRLVRVAPEGFYEVTLESRGKQLHQPAAHPVDRDPGRRGRGGGRHPRGGALKG